MMRRYLANNDTSHNALPPATPSPTQHGPSSRRLGKMRASEYLQASQASRASSSSSQPGSQASSAIYLDSPSSSPPPLPEGAPTHDYPLPTDKTAVCGVKFDVDFQHVYRKGKRLQPSRLGYAVRYKAYISGRRALSDIWRFGFQLQYTEDDNSITKL